MEALPAGPALPRGHAATRPGPDDGPFVVHCSPSATHAVPGVTSAPPQYSERQECGEVFLSVPFSRLKLIDKEAAPRQGRWTLQRTGH